MKTTRLALVVAALMILVFCGSSILADGPATAKQLGRQVITNPVASTALTVPAGTQWIFFTVDVQAVHMSFDGTAATTSDIKIGTGSWRSADDDAALPPLIRVINSAAGATTIYVSYWRRR